MSVVSVMAAYSDLLYVCIPGLQCAIVNLKVKVTLEQATKAQRGSRGTALLFI